MVGFIFVNFDLRIGAVDISQPPQVPQRSTSCARAGNRFGEGCFSFKASQKGACVLAKSNKLETSVCLSVSKSN